MPKTGQGNVTFNLARNRAAFQALINENEDDAWNLAQQNGRKPGKGGPHAKSNRAKSDKRVPFQLKDEAGTSAAAGPQSEAPGRMSVQHGLRQLLDIVGDGVDADLVSDTLVTCGGSVEHAVQVLFDMGLVRASDAGEAGK